MGASPIAANNVLLESTEPLTSEQKSLFAYFGEGAKIRPPYRILNPQRITIGDAAAIREGCHINAFSDLTFLMDYISPEYRSAFAESDYRYDSAIEIGREAQIGRFSFMSCTNSIFLESNVLFSERVFVGDNNHAISHPMVPIMQQPNQQGDPVRIGEGSWIGVGGTILPGTELGRNSVVGANSVVRGGSFPPNAVIGPPEAKLLFVRHSEES